MWKRKTKGFHTENQQQLANKDTLNKYLKEYPNQLRPKITVKHQKKVYVTGIVNLHKELQKARNTRDKERERKKKKRARRGEEEEQEEDEEEGRDPYIFREK